MRKHLYAVCVLLACGNFAAAQLGYEPPPQPTPKLIQAGRVLDVRKGSYLLNLEIIRSSTINGAELMGWSDRVGEIAAGKFADIIAVVGDPLQDVASLQHVSFVMKGAAVVRNEVAEK